MALQTRDRAGIEVDKIRQNSRCWGAAFTGSLSSISTTPAQVWSSDGS